MAKVKLWGKNMAYYHSLGYLGKQGDIIDVYVEDLLEGSHSEIEILCDMCKKNKITLPYKRYTRVVRETGSYVCRDCALKKTSLTIQRKYGVSSPAQLEEVRNKMKQTSLERYGVENYSQTKEWKEKYRQICLEKYNVENVFQLPSIKEKIKQTSLQRYGTEHPFQSTEIKDKQRDTMVERYGVPHVSQIPTVREKIANTFFTNGTIPTSKQQRYLNILFDGKLNYPIKHYCADICLPEEKIIIEFDGSGHDLEVRLGTCTQEKFSQREIIRSNIIKREGYKQIHIISKTDKLPSDAMLYQILSIAKEYFSNTSHSWINFDIDNSKIINAENKLVGGVFFDYGKLRKIKNVS